MSKIQLVIEIDEEIYSKIVNIYEYSFITLTKEQLERLDGAIRRGTPLPKGHGDLIDANEIRFENSEFDTYGDYSRAFDAIDQAEVIIEADGGGKNEVD